METNAFQEIPGIPSPSKKDHTPYIELISTASNWIKNHKSADPRISDPVADLIIYVSFLTSETEKWTERFRDSKNKAGLFYFNPNTYWRAIALGVSTPEVKRVCLELLPNLDRGKYFPYHIVPPDPEKIIYRPTTKPKRKHRPKRGQLWRLDRRWDLLWKSSRKVFKELCRRSQKPKNYFAFPWCQAGVPSLVKFARVSEHQVKRALQQLQNYSLIKRIVRGYEGTRGSKYYIFLTPKMSGAFYWKSLQTPKHLPSKKRILRMAQDKRSPQGQGLGMDPSPPLSIPFN